MKTIDQPAATMMVAKRPRIGSAVVIVLASIVLLVPSADNYCDTRASRLALENELDSQHNDNELQKLQLNLAQMEETHQLWQRRSVAPTHALEFQNQLIALARGLKCRVRHASLGLPHRKPWTADDDPFEDAEWAANRPDTAGRAASHVLATQSMKLTLEGSYPSCQRFISELQALDRLFGIKHIEFHPLAPDHNLIQIDIELFMFTLEAPKARTQPLNA